METLTKFYKGFNSFATMSLEDGFIVYNTKKPHDACDDARLRISELNLPLKARVTSYNTFIVEAA
jgi:hypothetical protein